MLLLALAGLAAAQPPAPALPPPPPSYTNDSDWLCLPGRADPCGAPLAVADLTPQGYGPVMQTRPAADPPVDCFYVYPTVSRDPAFHSDTTIGAEERAAAHVQFARFHEVCRTFAPVYRQVTLAALAPTAPPQEIGIAFEIAYSDVRNAWRQFIASRNQGRPFILVGHSQGSIHLQRLIREEIEGKPIAQRMVSAVLAGWSIEVPEGQQAGGTFRTTPLCTRSGQTGCILTWVSFRYDAPPPETGAMFGRAAREGMTVACTNPAALAGGRARLDSWWHTASESSRHISWSRAGTPPTPFLRTQGLVTAECVNRGKVGYLSVRVEADPQDARTDQIPGDVQIGGQRVPGWGLHLADLPLVMGDLIRVIEAQIAAFVTRQGERG